MPTSHRSASAIASLSLALLVGFASAAGAQSADPIFGARGFQQNRLYFAHSDAERVDTLSGRLMLRYVDLALPGNGGSLLRFGRTSETAAFAGPLDLPLRVNTDRQAGGEGNAYILTADGHTHYADTVAPTPYNAAGCNWTCAFRWTSDFWLFDRDVRVVSFDGVDRAVYTVYMPDGTVNYFDATSIAAIQNDANPNDADQLASRDRLLYSVDPFGNRVGMTWSATGLLVVRQRLSANLADDRVVTLKYDPQFVSLQWMTYAGRTWTYETTGTTFVARAPSADGSAPGLEWRYERPTFDTLIITNPYGGQVTYTLALHEFMRDQVGRRVCVDHPVPIPDVMCGVDVVVVVARTATGEGTWTYSYSSPPSLPVLDETTVTSPSGVVSWFRYGYWALADGTAVPGAQLLEREVRQGGVLKEREERSYTRVSNMFAVPLVTSLQRDGQTFTTTRTYTNDTYRDFGNPSVVTDVGHNLTETTTTEYVRGGFSPGAPLHLIKPWRIRHAVNGGTPVETTREYAPVTGFLTREVAAGLETQYVPDPRGNVAKVIKGNGVETGFLYRYGVVSDIITSAHTTTRQINPEGTVQSETQGLRTTIFEYDNLFRVKRSAPSGANAVVTTYDTNDVTVQRGAWYSHTKLDGFGRPEYTETSAGGRVTFGYDNEGRQRFESDPAAGPSGVGTYLTYDALGRVVARRHGTNQASDPTVTTTYAPGTVTMVDEEGRATVQHWASTAGGTSRLVALVDADGKTWSYEYNVLGKLTKVTAPEGFVRQWTYDAARPGLLTSESHPESGTVVYQAYDAAGNLTQKVDAKGTTFKYFYDANDRVWKVEAGTRTTTFTFETWSDNRESATVSGGTSTSYQYDVVGRLSSRTDTVPAQPPLQQVFSYDDNDNLREVVYASGRRVRYTYNAGNQVVTVEDVTPGPVPSFSSIYAANAQYTPAGALQSYQAGNTLQHGFTYDDRHRVTRITAGSVFDLQYLNYDRVGNVRQIVDANRNTQQTFDYDVLDRLTRAVGPYGDARYAYGPSGDRQSNEAASYTYVNQRLATQNSQQFTYDPNGNLATATQPTATFTYTPDNQLDASTVGGVTASYGYDADGWRVSKVSGGVASLFARGLGGQLMTEVRPNAYRDYVYLSGKLIAMVTNRRAGADPTVPDAGASAPEPGTGRVNFSFAATAPAGMASASLQRAPGSTACTPTTPTACSFSQVDAEPAPAGTTTWSSATALSDVPPAGGTFVYRVTVTDVDGGVGSSSALSVAVADDTPDAFSFSDITGAVTGATVSSNILAVTGIAGSVATSITGGSYRVCADATCAANPAFGTQASTITNGAYLQVQATASTQFNAVVNTTITVGTVSDTWSVSTAAQDLTPNAFSFTDQTGIAVGTLVTSNVLQISGITGTVPVSMVSGNGGGAYRVCPTAACATNPAFVTTAGSVTNGQYLQLRLTASSNFTATRNTTVTVGTVSDQWSVTTAAQDTSPDPFTVPSASNVPIHSYTYSAKVAVTGISGNVAISVSGGGEKYLQVCDDANCNTGAEWTTGATTIANNQYFRLNIVSPATHGTTDTRTITVGTYATTWVITTVADACGGSPSPGTTCADGTKFVGYANGTKFYTTPNDYGYQAFAWPEALWGGTTWSDGRANTNGLAAQGNYAAANACGYLTAYGKDDWYLPSPGEWSVLDPQRGAVGGFAQDETLYWTSTEMDGGDWFGGFYHSLGSDFNGYTGQGLWLAVRCVRRD